MSNTTTKSTPAQRTPALLTVNLSKTKETPGTVRYDSPQNETDRVGRAINIYVPKTVFKGDAPQNVTLTITAA